MERDQLNYPITIVSIICVLMLIALVFGPTKNEAVDANASEQTTVAEQIVAPETAAPVTQAPETAAPTTAAPATTAAPETTVAPETQAATTAASAEQTTAAPAETTAAATNALPSTPEEILAKYTVIVDKALTSAGIGCFATIF